MLNAILGMNHLAKVRVRVSLCGRMTKGRAANAGNLNGRACLLGVGEMRGIQLRVLL